ncbi:MAG: protein kinase [Labilithrix sp.]
MSDSTQPMFAGGELLAGKYRVERMIGSGGMGVVLAARHEGLNTDVAIKLLRQAALGHTDVVGRFMREARAAVSLRSEHVARVYDVGTLESGAPYIVMERLQGRDLGEICEAPTRPAIGECVDYVMQACEAIAEAHAAGIIHRDLKPKNLFLTHTVSGRPLIKVLDFGISKVDPNVSPGEMQLTKTTEIIGSPSYMSPEQLRSARNVDTRTDIWALGVILYELLTGRVPFNAETVTELVLVVVTEQQMRIRAVRPEVPEGLQAVVDRCLEKNPDARYQSVVDLVAALEPYAHLVQITATDRIRAVAHSGRPTPGGSISGTAVMNTGPSTGPNTKPSGPTPSSGSLPSSGSGSVPLISGIPPANSSSRVNVHGGTSVAWGETQSAVQQLPSIPVAAAGLPSKRSTSALAVGIGALIGTLMLGAAGVAFMYSTKDRTTHAPPPPTASTVVAKDDVPLPPGRKDLPPSTAPLPTPSIETPTPSAMPEDRKPGPIPLPKPAPQPVTRPVAPAPAPGPKPDDLDGIGRR